MRVFAAVMRNSWLRFLEEMQSSLSYFRRISLGLSLLHKTWIISAYQFKRTLSVLSAVHCRLGEENISIRHFASSADGNGRNSSARYLAGASRLLEIGRLEDQKVGEVYEPGQAFLHKIFGFRGVILYPWTATVHEVDAGSSDGVTQAAVDPARLVLRDATDQQTETAKDSPAVVMTFQTYYQVLVDTRDAEALRTVYQDEISVRKDDPFSVLFPALRGFAFVAHEDVLPYTPTESVPIEHEHFGRFLSNVPGKSTTYTEKPTLLSWRSKFQEALRLTEVRRETCEKVRLTVMPFFLGYSVSTSVAKRRTYCWVYTVRLENLARDTVIVRDEEWTVLDSDMKKPMVIERPLTKSQNLRLTPESPAFQCQSRVQLPTRSGFIWGRITMEREDGTTFQCRIPAVSLQSPKTNAGLGVPVINDVPER